MTGDTTMGALMPKRGSEMEWTLSFDEDGVHMTYEYWNSILKQIADLEEEIETLQNYVIEQVGAEHVPSCWGGELE